MGHKKGQIAAPERSAGKKAKGATQRTPQQRIAVMGHTGKIRFEWRDWA